jgi:hypothetical protein
VHVIGISPETSRDRVTRTQLEPASRWRFDVWNQHTIAYLYLFEDSFNEFARRDSDNDLSGIHALIHLNGPDLAEALGICDSIEQQLLHRPRCWRTFIGTRKNPGEVERRMEPLLFRRRALGCASRLRDLIRRAIEEGKSVVLGSGGYYRALCGITGGEYYS